MNNEPNYLQKIENPEIIMKLSALTGGEVWNATYSDAVNDLCAKGFYIVVEPFETKATKDGICWCSKYKKLVSADNKKLVSASNKKLVSAGNKKLVYAYESPEAYISWKDAIESVLIDALNNCLDQTLTDKTASTKTNTGTETASTKTNTGTETVSNNTVTETHDPVIDDIHRYGSDLYGRHTKDDPFPFE